MRIEALLVFVCHVFTIAFYVLYLGATKATAVNGITTEMVREKPSGQAESKVKSFGHLNGLAVRPQLQPNMPAMTSECGSRENIAIVRRKSDSAVLSMKSGVQSLSVDTAVCRTTVNGQLPQSSLVLKSRTLSGYEVPSTPTAHNTSGSIKRLELNNRDCFLKKNEVATGELYRNKNGVSDSFVEKAVSGQKMRVQSEHESALMTTSDVEHCLSKWNCSVNLHKKDQVQTFGNNSTIDDEATVAGSTSHHKSVGGSEKARKCNKKLPGTKPTSFPSTTTWHVTPYSSDGVLTDASDLVHATTRWHVADVTGKCDVLVAETSDHTPQYDTSAASKEAVYGGLDYTPRHKSVVHDKTGDSRSTSVRRTVNCMYHQCVSLLFTYNFCHLTFDSLAWYLFTLFSVIRHNVLSSRDHHV